MQFKLNPQSNPTNKKECFCDNPTCSKCLGINCQDFNCSIHKISHKILTRERFLLNANPNDLEKIKQYQKEIEELKEWRSSNNSI